MMENDVKCRIKEYLRANGSNPSKVAAKYSVNQKTLSSQINGVTTLSVSTILLILDMFPKLSSEWLLRGIGSPEKEELSDRVDMLENKYERLMEEFDRNFKEIKDLPERRKKGA